MIQTSHLFRPLLAMLIELLRGLDADQWELHGSLTHDTAVNIAATRRLVTLEK